MRILFNGCSWTYGSKLINPEEERFSRLICKELGAIERNIAVSGSSNHYILRENFIELEKNDYDICFTQITYPARFSIPLQDKIVTIAPKFRSKKVLDRFFLRAFFSSVTSMDIWLDYDYPTIVMFNEYCKAKKVKAIFVFVEDLFLNYFKQKNTKNLDYIDGFSLHGVCDKKKLPYAPGLHPTKTGHEEIAKQLLIEIQKRI